jgi:hypothetical protein
LGLELEPDWVGFEIGVRGEFRIRVRVRVRVRVGIRIRA